MGQPTASDVHVDQILSNISIKYKNRLYIGEKIFPLVRSEKQSDKYYLFPLSEWFRDEAKKRAPGSASEGGGFPLSDDTFFCEERSFHTQLEDEVLKNADSVLRIEANKTDFVTEKILIRLERVVADMCFTAGNWSNSVTLSGTNQWSDYDNSDPIANLETGIDAVEDATGMPVNTIVIGKSVWRKIKHHPQLLDRLPSTGLKTATVATLRDLLQNGDEAPIRIMVGNALYNNAKRGADDSLTQIWGKHVWLGHVAEAPARETPSAGYTFYWPVEGQIRGVRRWREEKIHSDIIEAFMNFDDKVVSADLGYVIRDAVA